MAIMDAGPYQAWIAAHDRWERSSSRLHAAQKTGNQSLIAYIESDTEKARQELNAALRTMNELDAQARRGEWPG